MEANPDIVPTREEFEASGGKPEQYEQFLALRQEELAKLARDAAEKKAEGKAKFRVKGGPGSWRAGQSTYLVPAKAPLAKGPPEPGIRLKIGQVQYVPIRDEAHLSCLMEDPNLEGPLGDDVPTFEEEEALKAKVLADAKAAEAKARADLATAAAKAKLAQK